MQKQIVSRPLSYATWMILGSLLFNACGSGSKEIEQKTGGGAKALPVGYFTVEMGNVNRELNVSGSLMANEEVMIRSEIQGRVLGIHFEEGKSVSKGQLLFKIDDAEFASQLKKSKVLLQLAESEKKRAEGLFKADAISKEQLDQLVARVAELEAEVQLLSVKVARCHIQAPFTGKIGLRQVSIGSYVNVGELLVSLQQVNPLKIEFDIPEVYAPYISINQTLSFGISGAKEQYTAKIFATEPGINIETRSMKVRALVQNQNQQLIPGTFADVKVLISAMPNSAMVPAEAIIPELNGQKVLVMQNGVAVSKKVKVGLRSSTAIQLLEGVLPGDTIITTGLLQLKDGSPVVAGRRVAL